jgi:NADH:ubiquinone oxidoreductase subunit 4 (subunit M)
MSNNIWLTIMCLVLDLVVQTTMASIAKPETSNFLNEILAILAYIAVKSYSSMLNINEILAILAYIAVKSYSSMLPQLSCFMPSSQSGMASSAASG